jgi:hypothetical protein
MLVLDELWYSEISETDVCHILRCHFFVTPFLFANCTNASTFSKWCDGGRGRERGTHQHPSVIKGAKPGVEVGNRNTYKLTN